MKTPHHPDLGATLEQSRSGLRDSHRRSLMRLLFFVTGSALVVFACLQILNGYLWVGGAELAASAVLYFGVWRLKATTCLQQWIYAYLVTLFAFFLVIMLLPEASVAAFVWVLMLVFIHLYEVRREEAELRLVDMAQTDARIRVTASFGIAQWPDHGREAEGLFRVADRWLYSGKRAGRNRVVGAGHNPRQLEILNVEAS